MIRFQDSEGRFVFFHKSLCPKSFGRVLNVDTNKSIWNSFTLVSLIGTHLPYLPNTTITVGIFGRILFSVLRVCYFVPTSFSTVSPGLPRTGVQTSEPDKVLNLCAPERWNFVPRVGQNLTVVVPRESLVFSNWLNVSVLKRLRTFHSTCIPTRGKPHLRNGVVVSVATL